MKIRERQYQDADLASELEHYMTTELNFPSGSISRGTSKGERSTLYLKYNGKEYVIAFSSERNARFLVIHLEKPTTDLVDKLKKDLIGDSIFKRLKYLRKGNLARCKQFFKREFVSTSELSSFGREKPVPTVFLLTEIRELPLSKKGHLSGKFTKYVYDYNIRPFIAGVENPNPNDD